VQELKTSHLIHSELTLLVGRHAGVEFHLLQSDRRQGREGAGPCWNTRKNNKTKMNDSPKTKQNKTKLEKIKIREKEM